ncbi:hypothetical protein F2Q70_00040959 [Brassica cretica]|uniref:Glucose-methanol-choline oxidoreductase N-terminal domain-containing protein n=1 Tax=Brassica cretica TaxID=69181 RepID=A0A8S9K1N0_BRACR|nr:hypothetical protein F2Q70_00040959 [Brassica cretica]
MNFCYREAGYYSFSKDAATSAPMLSHFDYIVIGGGTAGCALAATLSQNATVLVLERGGSPYDNLTATDIGNFLNTLLNTTPNSWSQLFISEDGVFNSRARVLGGGTVLNAGFYSRAEDEFVAETGWVREEVEAAYEWVEKKLVFEPQIKGWQTAFIDGLLEKFKIDEPSGSWTSCELPDPPNAPCVERLAWYPVWKRNKKQSMFL